MEREWKLGQDLLMEDNALDPITFKEIVDTVRCNGWNFTKTAVMKTIREIFEIRMEDFQFLVSNNIDEILEASKEGIGFVDD